MRARLGQSPGKENKYTSHSSVSVEYPTTLPTYATVLWALTPIAQPGHETSEGKKTNEDNTAQSMNQYDKTKPSQTTLEMSSQDMPEQPQTTTTITRPLQAPSKTCTISPTLND
jgi:hypothetical protein